MTANNTRVIAPIHNPLLRQRVERTFAFGKLVAEFLGWQINATGWRTLPFG